MKRSFRNFVSRLDSKKGAAIIVAAGLAIRAVALIGSVGAPLSSDAKGYHDAAVQIGTAGAVGTYWPPALPFYLSFWHRLFGASEVSSRASMIVWYVLFSAILLRLMKRLFTVRAANAALLVFAVMPSFVYHSIWPLTQLPAAAGLAAVVLFAIDLAEDGGWGERVALGCAFGFLALLRPGSVFLALLVTAYLFLKRRGVSSLVPLIVSLLLVSGWVIKAHTVTGRFVAISDASALNFFYGNNRYTPRYKTWWLASHREEADGVPAEFIELMRSIEREPPGERQAIFRRLSLEHIARRPDLFAARSASRVRCFFAFPTFTGSALRAQGIAGAGLSLVVVGLDAVIYSMIAMPFLLFICAGKGGAADRKCAAICLLAVIGYGMPYWLSFSHPTYNFPLIPVYFAGTAAYLSRAFGPGGRGALFPRSRGARARAVAAVAAFLLIQLEWAAHNWSRIPLQ